MRTLSIASDDFDAVLRDRQELIKPLLIIRRQHIGKTYRAGSERGYRSLGKRLEN
jgi:hypothetical protein